MGHDTFRRGAVVFTALAFLATRAGAQTSLWRLSSSFNYWTGKYGSPDRTSAVYIPFTAARLFSSGDVGLTVPYISVKGPGGVTLVNNVPARNPAGSTNQTTQSGLGDILLKGRYYLLDEREYVPTADLTAQVKFPTASRDRGLGTGEFDERVGLSLSKELTEPLFVVGDAGYTWVGSPPGITLQDRWDYLLGLGFHATKTLSASFNYEEVRALTPGDVNSRDVLYGVDWKATRDATVNVYLLSGLSQAAPDFGFTIGGSLRI